MYNKVKLTKRQIKEDKFTAFMLGSKQRLADNWQFIVIGVIVVALAVVGTVYFFNARADRVTEANLAYARALQDYRSGNHQVAAVALAQILEKYGSQQVAAHATFLLGRVNYDMRNYAEATRHFDMYLSKYRDNPLDRTAAAAGIAACLECEGKFLEAADKYVAAYTESPTGPSAADYVGSALRNYLAAQAIDKARAQLELLQKDFRGSEVTRSALILFGEKVQG
jgi:TolA-binding protein